MAISDNFDSIKELAAAAASTAADKAYILAERAKTKLGIRKQEDKIKKLYMQLGRLCYCDYLSDEEPRNEEYRQLCHKIDETKLVITKLHDYLERIGAEEQ